MSGVKAPCVSHAGNRVDGGVVELEDGAGQFTRSSGPEAAGYAVDHGFQHPAPSAGYDRPARRLTLNRGDPELLDRGNDQCPCLLKNLGHLFVRHSAGEPDVWSRLLPEPTEL